jgi:hypothetical protein
VRERGGGYIVKGRKGQMQERERGVEGMKELGEKIR